MRLQFRLIMRFIKRLPFSKVPSHPYQKDVNRFPLLPAGVVFLTLLILIAFSWRAATRAVEDDKKNKITERSALVESSIKGRLSAYEDVLHAANGFVNSSATAPTRDQWNKFVLSMELGGRYPGILGTGYAVEVAAADIDAFEQNIRAQGLPKFDVLPETGAPVKTVAIHYQEPARNSDPVTGYDMLSDPLRKTAIEQARDGDQVVLTSPLTLRVDAAKPQPAMIMYLPVYNTDLPTNTVDERRRALKGFAFMPFRAKEFINNTVEVNSSDFGFTIKSGDTQLYSNIDSPEKAAFKTIESHDFDVYGQKWRIEYYASDAIVSTALRNRPNGAIWGGLIFSLSVASSVYLLVRRRILDQAYYEERKLQTAKDDLLSLASHQLRTPATGVKQYIGMVLQGYVGPVEEEQGKMLNLAYESNERQLRIINEFLYMAKADAGRIVVSRNPFNLTTLVEEVIRDQNSELEKAGHKLIRHLTPNVMIIGDMHSIRMIIENLVNNAIKYTPDNGTIHVRLKKQDKKAVISVKDSGVGIRASDFAKLFKQFSRIPNSLTANTTGSGIGLYLSKHLAKLNKGDVEISTSKVGRGSTFTASFPLQSVKNITAYKYIKRG